MYLAAGFGLISIIKNSLSTSEKRMHRQFLPSSSCKSHRDLLVWPIFSEGAASSAAWWWVTCSPCAGLWELCNPAGYWCLGTAQVRPHCTSPRIRTSWPRRSPGLLLLLPAAHFTITPPHGHPVNPARETGCLKTRHFFLKPGQFSLRSVFWSLTAWPEKHLCRHRGRERARPSGEHGGDRKPVLVAEQASASLTRHGAVALIKTLKRASRQTRHGIQGINHGMKYIADHRMTQKSLKHIHLHWDTSSVRLRMSSIL